ncbi:hypothetical protein C0J52_26424 [Blattella germanica]|nr:hypothetical protein C0J52_26424 [Blattella germanica]
MRIQLTVSIVTCLQNIRRMIFNSCNIWKLQQKSATLSNTKRIDCFNSVILLIFHFLLTEVAVILASGEVLVVPFLEWLYDLQAASSFPEGPTDRPLHRLNAGVFPQPLARPIKVTTSGKRGTGGLQLRILNKKLNLKKAFYLQRIQIKNNTNILNAESNEMYLQTPQNYYTIHTELGREGRRRGAWQYGSDRWDNKPLNICKQIQLHGSIRCSIRNLSTGYLLFGHRTLREFLSMTLKCHETWNTQLQRQKLMAFMDNKNATLSNKMTRKTDAYEEHFLRLKRKTLSFKDNVQNSEFKLNEAGIATGSSWGFLTRSECFTSGPNRSQA